MVTVLHYHYVLVLPACKISILSLQWCVIFIVFLFFRVLCMLGTGHSAAPSILGKAGSKFQCLFSFPFDIVTQLTHALWVHPEFSLFLFVFTVCL